jgi:Lsr2
VAQRTEIVLTDDLDGSPAEATVGFGIDGVQYEIDLSAAHMAELRSALEPYITTARRAGGRAHRSGRGSASAGLTSYRQPDIRAWAREKGLKISARGRIPAAVTAQYEDAH